MNEPMKEETKQNVLGQQELTNKGRDTTKSTEATGTNE